MTAILTNIKTMSYNVNRPSLIVAWRLLCGLALLIGLAFSLESLLLAQITDINLTCSHSIGLIKTINQVNVNSEAATRALNPNHRANCVYTLTSLHNNTDGNNGLPSITGQTTIKGERATLECNRTAGTPSFRIFHLIGDGSCSPAVSAGSRPGPLVANSGSTEPTNLTSREPGQ